MKRLLLLAIVISFSGILLAQYAGTSYLGTPWQFGADSLANFSVGETLPWKNGNYHGIPHYAYDVGVVDSLRLPSEDPDGTLVAGSGWADSDQSPKLTDPLWREEQALVTLDASDIDAMYSNNYGGHFTTHNNRAVANGTGGWYRYSCDFAEGNYKVVIRGWGAVKSGHGFWIRFYDAGTMSPIYPWTRIHPGSGAGNTTDMENAIYADVLNDSLYVQNLTGKQPTQSDWIETIDEFSLNGNVVFEYSNIGPTLDHDEDVTGSGASFWGEVTFMHQGGQSDKFAPVAESYKTFYDDMMDFSLKLSEDGTLYLVASGTAIEDAEANNIDKMVMTTSDTYTTDLTEFDHPDTIQIVTMDAAGNSRITAPIRIVKAFSADKAQGETGDTIFVNTTREGYVALVPTTVSGERSAIELAIAMANADTLNVDGGNDTLVISTLTGDQDCNLYLVDMINDEVSYAIPFQLGEGTQVGIEHRNSKDVSVFADHDLIRINHIGNFEGLAIYDVLGKLCIHESVSSDNVTIEAGHLNSGVYFLKMYGNSAPVTKKFFLNK